ncbi:MAG: tRNA pseudouridine(55) synthase TruB [Eubacteriales bacterium]|nr:tRNA pseudouridine(55) synthase TruB [Eubacteriales bacterium]
MNNYTGFLNVYKEKGMTSMAVCARIRRILHVTKVGHAGTLDPMAEGVLPVALGRACKSVTEVGDGTKVYEAGMLLGTVTDTQDITGTVLSKTDEIPTEDEVRAAVSGFLGEYDQLTPMYSARQVDGRRLYDIAREGGEIERPRKKIEILSLEILSIDLPHVMFRVKCSKGTYVRTLCNDIGERLGCGACMESLKRTAVGSFEVNDTLTFSDIERLYEEGSVDEALRVVAPTAVSIGKFDGTHEGHQVLLRELRKKAEKHKLRSLVLILDIPGKKIDDIEERRERILSMGIDYCIVLKLTKELMSMEAEDFLKTILKDKLNMHYLVGGKDVAIGKDRKGDAEFLKKNASKYSYSFKLIDKVSAHDEVISSTLIRKALSEGNMEEVTELLGRSYFIKGPVVTGNNIGHSKLVATANQDVSENRELPPFGVYASRITVYGKEDKQLRNDLTAPKRNVETVYGVSNLGTKPTITGGKEGVRPNLETHIFDREVDLYDKEIKVELLSFIRPETRFDSIDALKERIEKDICEAKKRLEKYTLL